MRKSIITIITMTFALLMIPNKAAAQQDPNFTLYNFNMNIINPAFAGIKESPELNFVYRSQWIGVDDAPRTATIAYSRALGSNLGIGVSLINDRVFVLDQTDVAIDFSYRLKMSEKTNFYFGLKAGGGFVNIDLTRVSTPGTDPLFMQNQSFFNPHIGAGINIQNEKFYISISTPNFLNGDRYEKQGNTPSVAVENVHLYMGGGYNFTLSDSMVLTPRFMMRTVEGAPTSYDIGSSLEINNKIIAGANLRVDEMVSIYGLFNVIDNLKLGFAYDITMSNLSIANDNGSLEFILKYQFK
ncbi:MAG: type IX secretion system membrane protein PorP/SprF [Flavobacteriaceae bacterium]